MEIEIIRHILNASMDAIVAMDSAGQILEWNGKAEAILGWTAEEAVGKSMPGLIIPERFRSQYRNGFEHFLARGEGPIIGKRVEVMALRKDGVEIPAELTVTPSQVGGSTIFIGYLRDITVQKRERKRLEAQNTVLRVLSESTSMHAAEQKILNAIFGMESWHYGGFWRREGESLHCVAVKTRPAIDLSGFLDKTWSTAMNRGEGFPGRIWEIERPEWIPDFQDANFIRTSEAARYGLDLAFGFPVRLMNEVYGVFEFFGTEQGGHRAVRRPFSRTRIPSGP